MIDEFDLAWLAGFVDGEGNVGIYTAKSQTSWQVRLYVKGTHEPSMRHVEALFQELTVDLGHPVSWTIRAATERQKPAFGVVVSSLSGVRRVAKEILPYSVTKRAHLRQIIRFCDSRLAEPNANRRAYTPEEREILTWFSTANKRGPVAVVA